MVVTSAKGISRKEGGGGSQEIVEKGDKRARDLRGRSQDCQEDRPGKKKRQNSLVNRKGLWKPRPTFQSLVAGNACQETETEDRGIRMEKSTVTERTPEEGAGLRTPVREKARKINSRMKESPGKFPDKQYRISQFFGKKSPKAEG